MGIGKNGVAAAPILTHTIVNPYDTNYYIEPDGSIWVRLVHHNKPSSNGLFSATDTFEISVYKDEDKWFNMSLCNQLSSWEFLLEEKVKASDETVYRYRWIQSVNPMEAKYEDVTHAKITYNTDGYDTTTTYGGIYKSLIGRSYLVCNNGNSANYWGAIGCYEYHGTNALPGYAKLDITTGYLDVYVRVDNHITDKFKIYEQGFSANDFYEI